MLRSRLQQLLAPHRTYEQLGAEDAEQDELEDSITSDEPSSAAFSWVEYGIFLWMGVSMLWAWNMFLAAAPYFQRRFDSNPWTRTNFQPSILSVSCITNLSSVFILAKLQKNASYPRRIRISILLNMVVFTILALSTILFRKVSVWLYFVFIMLMVFATSIATGTNQNGVFAYVAGFGRSEYTQGITVGQGVAGVLPCIVQIVAVLAVPETSTNVQDESVQYQSANSAFAYFATATGVSVVALLAFFYLHSFHRSRSPKVSILQEDAEDLPVKKSIPLLTIFSRVPWFSCAMFMTFVITMIYPVFTAEIHSVRESESPAPSRIFQPAAFIPLGFLFWNSGDLLGRMLMAIPTLKSLIHHSFLLFIISLARILFLFLYLMCNIRGEGAKINSDFFYLFIVQLLFGATNGLLCAACMVGAIDSVDDEEKEAVGGFMGVMLASGLSAGSLASFFVAMF